MNYIEQIFDRANIQDVCEFLLHGNECMDFSSLNYKERLEKKEKQVTKFLEQKYPNRADCEKIMSEIYSYITETENVYMEIGLQCGFHLAIQIFQNTDSKESDRCTNWY